MQLTCPNCRCTIDADTAAGAEALRCPACGSTFRLEADETGPWVAEGSSRPSASVEIGQTILEAALGHLVGAR